MLYALMLVVTAVVSGLVAISLPEPRRTAFARELALLVLLFFAYFGLRGLTEGAPSEALAHGRRVEDLERVLRIFVEPELQSAIIDRGWLVEVGNLLYIWAHWPVLGMVAIWLYHQHPARYVAYRNAIVLSGAVGILIFALYPVAPPRLASPEIIGTIGERSGYYEDFQPSFLRNQFAAVPSFHVGWSVLIGIALIHESPRWWAKILGLAVPLVMIWAVVVTGNHYLIDGVVGTALTVGALVIASRWLSRRTDDSSTASAVRGMAKTDESCDLALTQSDSSDRR